jgi:hypothetical protein
MDDDVLNERLRSLEERIGRMEERLDLRPAGVPPAEAPVSGEPPGPRREEEEIEFELGQSWFARTGIVVLALGMVFLLTLPWTGLPPALPALIGLALAGSLFLAARVLRSSYDMVSRYLRGAGMALLFFAVLRLFYFSPVSALEPASAPGIAVLLGVIVLNIAIALRRRSPWLFALALFTGYAGGLAAGPSWFVLPAIVAMAVVTSAAAPRAGWIAVLGLSTVLASLAHLLWALNNPVAGNPAGFITGAPGGVYLLMAYAVIFATGALRRKAREREDPDLIAASFLNGAACYGVFLLHTAVSYEPSMAVSNLAASAVFLGLGIVFWVREKSRYSTFLYAMIGYLALSVAIVKASQVPELFVWLSLQSLVVVATAVWFRSRFIVVANFVIYVAIVVGYLVVGGTETGISIGFGVVALASARILNWQQDRLELKTGMMRNAYLASAFLALPYAAYHLVPREYVSLSWVGIAGFYYLMNLLVRAQKYRWMGHLTLLLTVLYTVVVGVAQLPPAWRIVSFLVLGTVLLAGSLVFTRLRMKRRARRSAETPAGGA